MNKKLLIIVGIALSVLAIGAAVFCIVWFSTHPNVIVTFDPNGGTYSETEKKIRYKSPYVLYSPKRDGYEFDGWYNGSEFIGQSGTWKFKENIVLRAKWKYIDEYKNVYNDESGRLVLNKYKGEVESIIKINFTKVSYLSEISVDVFGDIKTKGQDKNIDEIIILAPSTLEKIDEKILNDSYFRIVRYDVITDDGFVYCFENNEAILTAYIGSYEKDIVIPEFYEDKRITKIGEKVFLGAQDKIKDSGSGFFRICIPETVNYIGNNAFGDCNNIKPCLYYTNENNSFEEIVNLSRLVNWAKETVVGDGNKHVVDVITSIRSAIGWSAYSLARIYVTFDANGGSVENSNMILTMNKEYTLPVPVKDNCTFDGWYIGEKKLAVTGTWKTAAHVTLTAKWIPND